MSSKSEMKREYKEMPVEAGIFLITNTANGKVLLGSSTNLRGPLNKHRFMLSSRSHTNAALQRDWDTLGRDAFRFEIVAVIKPKPDDPTFSLRVELEALEEAWIAKLQPFGERGYNLNARIRE
jgi:hypothetical protein